MSPFVKEKYCIGCFNTPPSEKNPKQNPNQNTVNLLYLQRNYYCIDNFGSEIEILQRYPESDDIFFSVAHASANVPGGQKKS